MFRRASLAAFLLLILSVANVMAATTTVGISKTAYTPATATVAMGGTVQWKNNTGAKRNVTPDSAFLGTFFFPSTNIKAHRAKTLTFPEAGTFTYHDSTSAVLRGTVSVPMKADVAVLSLGGSVTLTVGTVPASSGGPEWHEIWGRVNGGAWVVAGTTGANSFGYKPASAGTWEFQTRIHHALSGANTGWSPTLTVTVI